MQSHHISLRDFRGKINLSFYFGWGTSTMGCMLNQGNTCKDELQMFFRLTSWLFNNRVDIFKIFCSIWKYQKHVILSDYFQ